MADLRRWLPEPPDFGGFRFGDEGGDLAHLSDEELVQRAREAWQDLEPEEWENLVEPFRRRARRWEP